MTITTRVETDRFGWKNVSRAAQLYVAVVIAAGVVAGAVAVTAPVAVPQPWLFAFLLLTACVTSAWKVNLPISLANGSTLSVSYAADLTALLLLGSPAAIVIAAASSLTQCTVNVKQRYPIYRTAFSVAAAMVTMAATGLVYQAFGGTNGPFDVAALMKPLVAAIVTCFSVNTGLVACAIALSTDRRPWQVWREDFLWSSTSFMVAGGAGGLAAVIIDRGEHWKALLMLAPLYLIYRTYQVFVARLEEQKRHVAELAEADRLKDQFLATVSHELRTPMNAILGWADILRLNALPESRRSRACEAIFNNATRQARLIDELLDMARLMAGKLQLQRTDIFPKDLVAAALEIVQIGADAKRIHLEVDVDPTLGPIRGDGPRLQQVLWNLLANAVKFTPEGGTVQLCARRTHDSIEFVVSDSGIGIRRDFLPSVFEPFRQADGSPTREHDGLGLGLAIVKQLVHAHGGTIEVESAGEGCGSTFTVRLPQADQRFVNAADAVPSTVAPEMTVARTAYAPAVSLSSANSASATSMPSLGSGVTRRSISGV
jgi:signal transduction histidine kinase